MFRPFKDSYAPLIFEFSFDLVFEIEISFWNKGEYEAMQYDAEK